MEHSGSIVGFCGRSGNFTDAIGVYVAVWNPERFYDSMRRQGVRVYRASPLRMDLRQIEEEKKKEEVERGRLQKEIKEGRERLLKLRLKLGVDVLQQYQEIVQQLERGREGKRQTIEELQVEHEQLERERGRLRKELDLKRLRESRLEVELNHMQTWWSKITHL